MKLIYKKGDLTLHKKPKSVICHCVNDVNAMGSGVAKALLTRWPQVKSEYHDWGNAGVYLRGKNRIPFVLGQIQLVEVGKNLQVCNLIGQRDICFYKTIPPVRYQSIHEGLLRLKDWMAANKYTTLALPRIASGLAGGSWDHIEKIINHVYEKSDIEVVVYDNEVVEGTEYQ